MEIEVDVLGSPSLIVDTTMYVNWQSPCGSDPKSEVELGLLFYLAGAAPALSKIERERESITKSKHVLVWKPFTPNIL